MLLVIVLSRNVKIRPSLEEKGQVNSTRNSMNVRGLKRPDSFITPFPFLTFLVFVHPGTRRNTPSHFMVLIPERRSDGHLCNADFTYIMMMWPPGIYSFTITAEILARRYWLIFTVDKRTDTWIYNLCDNLLSTRLPPRSTRRRVDPLGYRLVDPQLLWQCYDQIHDR